MIVYYVFLFEIKKSTFKNLVKETKVQKVDFLFTISCVASVGISFYIL